MNPQIEKRCTQYLRIQKEKICLLFEILLIEEGRGTHPIERNKQNGRALCIVLELVYSKIWYKKLKKENIIKYYIKILVYVFRSEISIHTNT